MAASDQPATQLGFDGMPNRLFSATPSRLNTWADCPRRYRMTYIDRPKPQTGPPWAHNSFGASVHNALAGWYRLEPERRDLPAAERLLRSGWLVDGYRDGQQSARYLELAAEMLRGYVSTLDPNAEPVGVERSVATRTNELALSGRVDRIDERVLSRSELGDDVDDDDAGDATGDDAAAEGSGAAELVIVDYKTGRRPSTVEEARGSLALAVYALATARTLRRPCRRVELHHLPSGTVAGWTHTEESLGRHLRRATSIASDAAGATEVARTLPAGDTAAVDRVFPPVPSQICAWCDFVALCPEGRAAAPAKQPWDGLATEQAGDGGGTGAGNADAGA
jgi:RecB family exonuclease